MFTARYKKWVSVIVSQKGVKYYFDGVKDLMKFNFAPGKYIKTSPGIKEIWVKDYYKGNYIPGKVAYYVIGSNITGPMGNEFIPFETKESAEVFMKDHYGKKIVRFREITPEMVEAQDR